MARLATAAEIINRVALEVGLSPAVDPYSSTNDAFEQLTGLLNAAGQELVELHAWQRFKRTHTFSTTLDENEYDLPDDFSYMVDQTGWDRTNQLPLFGPTSSQMWAYLAGRNLTDQTVYITFRENDGKIVVYPESPTVGLSIAFEYVSRNWVQDPSTPGYAGRQDEADSASLQILYEPILIQKFLKAKFLEAKGFDASSARLEFENMFLSRTGKDEGAPVLSASNRVGGIHYLSPYTNTGDTNFGV